MPLFVQFHYVQSQDWWTFEVIVILSGLLPRPEMTMSMMGITFNVHALCFFAAHGLSGAASTRVGNELGQRSVHVHVHVNCSPCSRRPL
jgi:Na+-driven multidrug efflux pump